MQLARTDPAWDEARRIQSSLIDVQDSWVDPSELDEGPETDRDMLRVMLDDGDDIEVIHDLYGQELPFEPGASISEIRASALLNDPWFDEAPTLPRAVLPPSARDTIRPTMGAVSEHTVTVDLESSSRPVVKVEPFSALGELDAMEWKEVEDLLRACPEFKDTPDAKIDELLSLGMLVRMSQNAALAGWDAGVLLSGQVGLLRWGLISRRVEPGQSVSSSGTIPSVAVHIAATHSDTTLIAWNRPTLERVLDTCPWVMESLRARADTIQTLAVIPFGSVVGYMGAGFVDDLIEASRVVVLSPGAQLVQATMGVHALNIVGVGDIELVDEDGSITVMESGQILFSNELVSGAAAPKTARAGERGATVLHVEAVELSRFLPHVPLLERALEAV